MADGFVTKIAGESVSEQGRAARGLAKRGRGRDMEALLSNDDDKKDEPTALEVVIVDDHDDTREVAAEVLRLQGFAVRDFARAEDALDAMELAPPSAAIIDLTLGAMSGEDLARRLRSTGTADHTALVAMTGHTSARENPERLWDCVLIKPVDPFELAKTLRELVSQR